VCRVWILATTTSSAGITERTRRRTSRQGCILVRSRNGLSSEAETDLDTRKISRIRIGVSQRIQYSKRVKSEESLCSSGRVIVRSCCEDTLESERSY
jgi:hypothetical protein